MAIAFSTLPDDSRVARPLASAGKRGQIFVPSLGRLLLLHPVELLPPGRDIALAYSLNSAFHCSLNCRPRLPMHIAEILAHAVGNQKLGVFRPAVDALRQLDFLFAERFAVGRLGVLPWGEP